MKEKPRPAYTNSSNEINCRNKLIRSMRASGEDLPSLSEKFNLGIPTITMICKGLPPKTRFLSHEEHVERVMKVHGDRVSVVGRYNGAHDRIEYSCPDHGPWMAKPMNVVNNESGCKKCWNSGRPKKSHETYVKQAEEKGFKVLETYTFAVFPIIHECSFGHKWKTSPSRVLSGDGCPLCDKSQYRRRPIMVGEREVLVQGGEGKAVQILLEEGFSPGDLAFTCKEGRPTFRYHFDGKDRLYIPDIFIRSTEQIIEVKSDATLGVYNKDFFLQVQAKSWSVIKNGYGFRLMLIYRGRNVDIGINWMTQNWETFHEEFRRIASEIDRRNYIRRKRCPRTGRYSNAPGFIFEEPKISKGSPEKS